MCARTTAPADPTGQRTRRPPAGDIPTFDRLRRPRRHDPLDPRAGSHPRRRAADRRARRMTVHALICALAILALVAFFAGGRGRTAL
jgi:hypothetical protein